MAKKLFIVVLLFIAVISCLYIFIPSKLNVSVITTMKAPLNGVFRCVSDNNMWSRWSVLPDDTLNKKIIGSNQFNNAVDILIYYKNDSVNTSMNLLRLTGDSIVVQWKFSMPSGSDPFTRISKYNEAVSLKKKMDYTLNQLKTFVLKDENIYGFAIHESSIKDTFLVAAKTILPNYPQTNDIYSLIDKLKDFTQKSNVQVTGYPMYNVTKINNDSTRLMVALPVNKEVKEADSVFPVRMVPGRFLIGQVTGGNETVKNALVQMQYYFAEHNRTAMAIPFCYIVTDRRQQPDTSKWVTKIYGPVF